MEEITDISSLIALTEKMLSTAQEQIKEVEKEVKVTKAETNTSLPSSEVEELKTMIAHAKVAKASVDNILKFLNEHGVEKAYSKFLEKHPEDSDVSFLQDTVMEKESIRFDDALKLFGFTREEMDRQIERNPYHALDKLYSSKINKMRALKEKLLDVQRPSPQETDEIVEKYKVSREDAYKYKIADAFEALQIMLPSREVLKARQIKPTIDAVSGIEVQLRQFSDAFSMILTYMLVPIIERAKQKDADVANKTTESAKLDKAIKEKKAELEDYESRKKAIDEHNAFERGEEARIKERKVALEAKIVELEGDKTKLLTEINELEAERDKLKKKNNGDDEEEE